MANRWENSGNTGWLFFWARKSLQMVTAAMKLRYLLLGRKVMTNLDSILKSRDITVSAQYFGHWCQELTHLITPWCWERLRAGGEGDDRGWDGWMASPTQWTWVWVDSRSWWWTGRPGVLWFMGLQRVGHDWAIELNWTDTYVSLFLQI